MDKQAFGVGSATLLVVATMIGTGVFTTFGFQVDALPSTYTALVAWIVGGALALCGALAYAELAAAIPLNGGEYPLLGRIYHPAAGFVSAWLGLVVGFAAPLASAAIAFSKYAAPLLPGVDSRLAAAGLIVVLSALHAVHVGGGRRVQDAVTVLKVALIVAVIVALAGTGKLTLPPPERISDVLSASLSGPFAVGLVYISFAYSGWNAAAYVTAEVHEPGKNVPRALILGTLAVTLLYLALNVVFAMAAPAAAFRGQPEVALIAARAVLSEKAALAVSAVIAAGLVSTVGAFVVAGARIYEAVGRDYPRLRVLGIRREPRGGPVVAIALQATLALLMVGTSSFEALLTYMGLTLSAVAALTVAGVFVLRRREPNLPRPYRTWGHPWTTGAHVLLAGWMIVYAIIERPIAGAFSAATVLAGLGLWYFAAKPVRAKPVPE